MHRLEFSIDIKAGEAKIWNALWDQYRDWAAIFEEGSYAEADPGWKEGSEVLFLSPEGNGIYSEVEEHIPNQLMRFRHIGSVVKGNKQPVDDETKKWSGATEEYKITSGGTYNTLTIALDVMDEHLEFMKDKLPKALEKIKSMAIG